MADDRVHIFGIRHHGPGSARSLEHALESLAPDCVLIEGPPDAEPVLAQILHEQMQPPVALLVYRPDEPQRAAFFPFAEFSPEWRALRYGLSREIPTQFIDLPQSRQLVDEQPEQLATDVDTNDEVAPDKQLADRDLSRRDPLGLLAEAAGFSDGERWWDWLVESREARSIDVFTAIHEAMTALRTELPPSDDPREERREAHMRSRIRAALKDNFQRIAVVCGAWHAPALTPSRFPSVAQDNAVLAGLPKVKTEAAWCPWTYDRLSFGSGYGAGVVSPAWYELIWKCEEQVGTQWMIRVARLMRERELDTSSAHVIEAVRLAETLAAMRNRPQPGLEELDEAALAIVCGGEPAPMAVIRRRLVIGEKLGAIPEDAPLAPLQRDLAAEQKRLRFPAQAQVKKHDFDLRKPMDLERSQLLHRLNLLNVPWGTTAPRSHGAKGTFHEFWQTEWEPEFAVKLIEASRFGNTVAAAAEGRTADLAKNAESLAELTLLLDHALLANLPRGVEWLTAAIQDRAATNCDVLQLLAAVPALARAARYGNVRQTDAELVLHIVTGLVERIAIGLPGACQSLSDDSAAAMLLQLDHAHPALQSLSVESFLEAWFAALTALVERDATHPLLQGRAANLLHAAQRVDAAEVARWVQLALSPAAPRSAAAAWVEGFLTGSGMMLLHDQKLWSIVSGWVAGLSAEAFVETLPLLRRTFSTFAPAERRNLGELVQRGGGGASALSTESSSIRFNHQRAQRVLPQIAKLLGHPPIQ